MPPSYLMQPQPGSQVAQPTALPTTLPAQSTAPEGVQPSMDR